MQEDFLRKLQELESLHLPIGQFAITGSGPMAIRGLRAASDVDVVVKRSVWEDLLKKYQSYDGKHIKIGNVEIWGDFINLTETLDVVIDRAEMIEGYPYVTLEDTLCWKRYLNREKDRIDIQKIEQFLKLTNGI